MRTIRLPGTSKLKQPRSGMTQSKVDGATRTHGAARTQWCRRREEPNGAEGEKTLWCRTRALYDSSAWHRYPCRVEPKEVLHLGKCNHHHNGPEAVVSSAVYQWRASLPCMIRRLNAHPSQSPAFCLGGEALITQKFHRSKLLLW
jgi:hypothetical protein